ncbi:LCP family protein [Dermabacter sp. Marseille-Q3180]|uniref:LCP family protein n=1 Tax=Dermabacter sp. Marseille-Q3180 TaxID=2758090 RepID=UPI002025445A|nr:LCP family protein [Dermabacter sp. Marseille-Q3180]
MTVPESPEPSLPKRSAGRHRYARPTKADSIAQKNAQQRYEEAQREHGFDLSRRQASQFPKPGSTRAEAAVGTSTENAKRGSGARLAAGAAVTPLGDGVMRTEPLPNLRPRDHQNAAARENDDSIPTGAPASIGLGRRTSLEEGSLARASVWTASGSVFPGFGLIPTKWRGIGIALMAIVILIVGAFAALLAFGDPTTLVFRYGTRRPIVIGALIAVAVGTLVWVATIFVTNQLHNVREKLRGPARNASRALAYTLALIVALPGVYTAHSLYATQALLGNSKVFAGSEAHKLAPGKDPWANRERVNIMLLGQDAGPDRTGTRPDTIMVASIDTKTGRTALFSIPRNLQYVRFPKGSAPAEEFPEGFTYFGKDQNLINAVWSWAEGVRPDLFPGDDNPGLTATTMAVEETLGLKVDYYAMVNLQGFADLVDAIGGVDIEVERDIPIGGGASKVEGYVKKGWQHLDGFHALWYARSRHGSNDFDRNCRQQRIVRTVAEEANVSSLALNIPKLIGATERNIETDIPRTQVEAFADLAQRIQKGGFKSYPINPTVTPSGNPDYPYIKEWVKASIDDSMEGYGEVPVSGKPGGKAGSGTGVGVTNMRPLPAEPTTSPDDSEGDSDSSDADSTGDSTSTPAPEVNQDPLAPCMPGNEDPMG